MNDRRADLRIPVELSITQFIDDRPYESLTLDVSRSGLFASRQIQAMARSSRLIQVEIPLPGLEEPLWASAEVIYDAIDPFFHCSGLRFQNMAASHRRLLDEWVRSVSDEG